MSDLADDVTPEPERKGTQSCVPCRGWGYVQVAHLPGVKEECRACQGTGTEPPRTKDPRVPWELTPNDRRLLRSMRIDDKQ